MSAPATSPIEAALLAQAYRLLCKPHWPQTLQECLAHRVFGICVRGVARNLARSAAPYPITTRARPPQALRLPRPTFDARRAAANDREPT